jgi:hypothetical protein
MKEENPRRKLRKFGLTVGIALLVIGSVSWYRGGVRVPQILGGAGGLLVAFGLLLPRALQPVEKAWMAMAMVLGWINTRILLTLLFYVVFTPVGLIMSFFRDPLNRKFPDTSDSYWIRREAKGSDRPLYQRQF